MTAVQVRHVPVLAEAVARLAGGRHRAVDCTVGAGGHAALLLEAGAQVLAVDTDPAAVAAARERLDPARATVHHGRFADPAILHAIRGFRPEFILLDLGVSSYQLDSDARGFSFRPGIALDMRMDPAAAPTAARVLNGYPEGELARLFREHADEPRARRLARVIVRRRQARRFATSSDLVNAIREVLGPRAGPADFARLFQAVRIEVNDELGQLERALPALLEALVPGGLLAVISYHSGEDRIVKQAFAGWARSCVCPPGQPVCTCRGRALGALASRRPATPAPGEVAANPRARSARLRGFVKGDAS
ncbi:MAG: 16S rRNA (cytosine(1402)-N(4))-methyltransferase RsmH [Gemmatimonadetes bacterium]|nr:16S rRNA (cytosine(1402)-N(4))-methyltransferase RsmH [Gemmatimonadota bacterium]